jgi:hypothetical protein
MVENPKYCTGNHIRKKTINGPIANICFSIDELLYGSYIKYNPTSIDYISIKNILNVQSEASSKADASI